MNAFTSAVKSIAKKYNDTSLILRIAVDLVIGAVLALLCPGATWLEELGNLFVGALKGIAPVLVFVIVAIALAQGSSKLDPWFGTVVWLYMLTTFIAPPVGHHQHAIPAESRSGQGCHGGGRPAGLGRCPAGQHCIQSTERYHEWQLHRYPDVGLPVRPGYEDHRHRQRQKVSVGHLGRCLSDCASGHQPGSVRHHGPSVHQRGQQQPFRLYAVRPPAAVAGGYYAADVTCY